MDEAASTSVVLRIFSAAGRVASDVELESWAEILEDVPLSLPEASECVSQLLRTGNAPDLCRNPSDVRRALLAHKKRHEPYRPALGVGAPTDKETAKLRIAELRETLAAL